MLQLGFGPIVTTNACLLIGKCRNVDFSWDERCPVLLSVLEELRFMPSRAATLMGPSMIQFVSWKG